MNKRNLILVGGGGHCKSVIEVAESMGYHITGILDISENVGKKVLNYSIVGTDEEIAHFVPDNDFVVTVGQIKDAHIRIKLHQRIKDAGGFLPTIIAASAHVSNYAIIGEGCVIMHKAMVNADANIGNGCILNTFSNIEHDVVIGDFCHVFTGAMINGNCRIGESSFIGSQSVLANGVEVVSGCVIGAGAVVQKDIKQKGIYVGNPAVLKRKL